MKSPKEVLKEYWGYEAFRPLQEDIIRASLQGKPVLALLPTGGGKSVCFQVPALCLEGVCIVISPLIALMKDQVHQLKKRGIRAAAIYSGMSLREIDVTLDNCVHGGVKFLYVSPERLKTHLFQERAKRMKICLLAIDEAHCISQWGYDFRPPYLEISQFIEEVKIQRVMALTASATREVKDDILNRLGMQNPVVFKKSFARENLSYSVFDLENKEQKMLQVLKNVPGSSVIYVRSRKKTMVLAKYLQQMGISASYYHAGLSGHERSERQDDWIAGKVRVIVATNAFGMGIDKPDVRTVMHYDLPDSLEAYYQEAGRAGRDGNKAFAIALYHQGDLDDLQQRTDQMAVSVDFIQRVYQALANYYKLAVGSMAMTSYEFDYAHFTRNYNLPAVETYHALQKLQDEGLIQISDQFHNSSKVMFLMSHEEVYRYQVAHGALDGVIKALMRVYGGEMFSDYVQVNEWDIAKLLHSPASKVITQLRYLHETEVIEYQQATDQPQIIFLTARYEKNSLPLNKQQLAWRRQVAQDKVKAVVEYITNTVSCRTQIIQRYFDEKTDDLCGVCDRCLALKKKGVANEGLVKGALKSNGMTMQELKNHFSHVAEKDLMKQLRQMMDHGQLRINEDGLYELL